MDKRFALGRNEKRFFAFCIEAYNITNHATFGPPNVTPTSSPFGEITPSEHAAAYSDGLLQLFC
jgi:hypothetical protein